MAIEGTSHIWVKIFYLSPSASAKGLHPDSNNFFKNGCSSLNIHFRLGSSIVLGSFWYAHDRGTIKSCIRIQKNCFLGLSKK